MKRSMLLAAPALLFAVALNVHAQNQNCVNALYTTQRNQGYFATYSTNGACDGAVPTADQLCEGNAAGVIVNWQGCEQHYIPITCQVNNPNNKGCASAETAQMNQWENFDYCVNAFGNESEWFFCDPPGGWPEGQLKLPPLTPPDVQTVNSLIDRMTDADFAKLLKLRL
jgi:hypothetical protein